MGEHIHVFLGGAQGMDFKTAPPFDEIGWPVDRTCDADLSRLKLIEEEVAAKVEEEEEDPLLNLAQIGKIIL